MATSKYVSPYSQEQISKYTDMFFDGKDHSSDANYNAFMNDTEFQNAIASGIQGQVFDIGLTAADTLAPVDYTNPGASGTLNWINMESPRASDESNYWQTNAAPVINAPPNIVAQAQANPGIPINLTEGGQGYVWKDGELHQTNFVNNTGSPTSSVIPLVLAMMAPGIGTALGTSLGLSGTTAAIVGGAALGGGTAALTGADIEQGLLGGAIGGAGSGLSSSISNTLGTSGTLGSVIGGAGAGALTSLARGGDATQGLVTGGLSGLAQGILASNAQDMTVPTEVAQLPSEFDQYLAPVSDVTVPTEANILANNNQFMDSISQYQEPFGDTTSDVANTNWKELYATPTTNPATGETIVGGDVTQYPNQDFGASAQNALNNGTINTGPGGFTSGWQTSGSDRIMIQDDGTAIGINENGDSYSLNPEQVTTMIDNGQLNTAESGYVAATGGTGNTPGGSGATEEVASKGMSKEQWASLLKGFAGLFGTSLLSGANQPAVQQRQNNFVAPTQGVPTYSPEYFQQVQQGYNQLLPNQPRDVATPLQNWYNTPYSGKPDSVTAKLFGVI